METGARYGNERRAAFKDDSWFSQFRNGSNPWMARYVYALIFLVANLLAWVVRDYSSGALTEMERLKNCKGGHECLGAEGVLRVSLGCFHWSFSKIAFCLNTTTDVFFHYVPINSWYFKVIHVQRFVAFWMVVCKDYHVDCLDSHPLSIAFFLYSALWFGRLRTLVPGTLIPVIISCLQNMVFLLIQLISVISFITWLNDCCLSEKNAERCHIHVMLTATTAYVICIVGIIMMYIWYTPDPSCLLNIFFITWTLVLLQLMTSVSLHPKVNVGFLAPGLMGLYVVFICWCAIRSEPAGESCNRKAEASNRTDWLTIISFVVALLAMVIATFSTGIDSKCFQLQFRKDEPPAEDDVPYGYGFFHFVFATGAMYFAMLLIGWNTHHTIKKWTIDVGWTSTWVRIVNEWLAVCVYLWMLVAPIFLKSRQIDESSV
ncbi:hypothetical protein Patl1_13206 [Pistacia atlantica]|uniref:Uncharacterized protein n=1 Tax=Pistacia atlantica TaxID=434234 RepID=A0ACC1AWW3_9ROSI|nr:hypothetical protein Patl1_13206 [Pistacia atlantica]